MVASLLLTVNCAHCSGKLLIKSLTGAKLLLDTLRHGKSLSHWAQGRLKCEVFSSLDFLPNLMQ